MSALEGPTTSLSVVDDDHARGLVRSWLTSRLAVHASWGPRFLGGDSAARALAEAGEGLLLARTRDGHAFGALGLATSAHAGSQSLRYAVGDPELWRAGHGNEAVELLVGYAFRSLGAHRLEATVGTFNLPLLEAVQASGLAVEGVLRDYYYVDGEYHGALLCSQLRDEYDERRAAASSAVPESDKQRARELLAEYLRERAIDPLGRVLAP